MKKGTGAEDSPEKASPEVETSDSKVNFNCCVMGLATEVLPDKG